MLEREAESEGGDERRALGTMAATFSLSLSLSLSPSYPSPL
jgi:hypothetical protein